MIKKLLAFLKRLFPKPYQISDEEADKMEREGRIW